MVVKLQGEAQVKKSRIILDLRESGINDRCDPAEQVTLPRLLDAVKAIREEDAVPSLLSI